MKHPFRFFLPLPLFVFLSICCTEKEPDIIEVSSVTISTKAAEMIVGETLQLTATVQPSNATEKVLTWDSSDESVVSISPSGLATALKEGNAVITALAGKCVSVCQISVFKAQVSVTSIELDASTVDISVGETITLRALVKPDDATDKTVIWTSSNNSVATVKDGVVTAISEGEASISAQAGDKTATCKVVISNKTIPVKSITLSKTEITLVEGDSETLSATVLPEDATDKTLAWTSSDSSVATVEEGKVTAVKEGIAMITVVAGNESATCKVVVEKKPDSSIVDLGLSVKWRSFNLGASKPEEYGDYYAWGEIETKDNYTWQSYKWCMGSSNKMTKYCFTSSFGYDDFTDDKTVLDLEDDAAHIILGGKWRTPTGEEWTELRTKCTWTYTDNYNETGVRGMIITSNVEGYKDKSIFLPAAGYRYLGTWSNVGFYGRYWSSSLYAGTPIAALCVSFFYVGGPSWVNHDRYYGQSIRPVSD